MKTRAQKKPANAPGTQVEPPCPKCVLTRLSTAGETQWCEQHRDNLGRRHTYHYQPREVAGSENFSLAVHADREASAYQDKDS